MPCYQYELGNPLLCNATKSGQSLTNRCIDKRIHHSAVSGHMVPNYKYKFRHDAKIIEEDLSMARCKNKGQDSASL